MEDMVEADVADRRLVRVLTDWCAPFSGYHLYYPSRRQHSPAFTLLVNALRYQSEPKKAASAPPRQRRHRPRRAR
jgi:DNA-binding transcriptional LysR family regulator